MPFSRITRLLLFFLLACNVVFSQNLPGNHYTSANELPNNTVRSLLVDSNNILWIGTDNGVVKKENDAFKSYFEEDGLALNSCWAIAEDANGNIWFGSYGAGLSIYDGEKFRVISKKDGLAHNEINRLYSYRDHMYIGTSDGVSRVNINSFEVLSWKSPLEDELLRVTGFFLHDQEVYISTYKTGIYKLTQNRENPDLVKVNDHRFIYSVFPENDSIYSSNKGFFTKTGMEDYILKKHPEFAQYGSSIIWDHVKTANNKIYAAAWGIYDTNGGIFEIKDNQMISRAGDFNIPSKKIISLAYDKNFGKLYAGSMDAGLFEVQLDPQVEFHSIPGRDVYGFSFRGKNAAVLLDDGIFLKSRLGEKFISLDQLKDWQKAYVANTEIPLPKYEDSFYELDYSTPPAEISFYDIKASEGSFWVNTNIGIFAIKASGKLQRYIPLHSEEINFSEGGELIETHPYGGVRIYSDLEDFEYTHFRQEDPLTPTMVVNSLKKAGKTYLVSVFSGLYKWENGAFRSYLEDGTWQEKKLRHITQLNENLAMSNEFGDVFIVNDEEEFRILKKIPRASIEGNSISFLKSHNGSLLIGTEKGLNLYKDGSFIFLNEEQGLEQPFLGAELNENILSIGSRGGFYQIDLSRVTDTEPLIHNLDIKEVYVNNGHFPVKNIADNKRIELQHDENTLLLKFSTNAHPYPKKLSYQYRLNPKDEWSLPSSKPDIFLPFLPPRKYEVSVNVLDSSTGLNHTQTLAELSILPPFWRTWWFGLLVFSSLLLIVLGVYRYQINQHRQFEEQKRLIQQRVEETKMEALLAQMNPHFIFNAMNSIQNYILDSDIDNATVFLGDFAKLIRLNLDHCTQPKILLIEEIEYLRSYIRLENTRFDNSVKVAIEIDPAIDPYDIEIPTMLLQTFVENVFVHAFPASVQEPTLEISFKLLPGNILLCKIEDNGVGYSPGVSNSVHQSKGISLVKERLSLLGYHVTEALQVKTSKNKGTTALLKLHI
ncbi:histidine kinase [Gramella sp. GC03-9]|uniref:Histidine kinase n=1 Tax=Christiangramia oceanisediminis TaxID=2920386 RepID=A0A9X2I2F3_9FLAO|nr:histidine kinase [Gramella oceanisediminis]MCP9199766.1 histidine kinase [Gramella oceanisediminis]